jgi:hypothetical protein
MMRLFSEGIGQSRRNVLLKLDKLPCETKCMIDVVPYLGKHTATADAFVTKSR